MGRFEGSREPVWIVCPVSTTVTEVNPAALEFSGYQKDQLIGKTVDNFGPPDGAEAILRHCIPFDKKSSPAPAYGADVIPFIKKDGPKENAEKA